MSKMLPPRERILDVAGNLFMNRGYELVGVNEIIEKSNVAKATFYNHFKSKELLCKSWLKSVWENSEAKNQSIVGNNSSVSEKITQKYKYLEESLISNSYRGCPFTNTKIMLPDSETISNIILGYKNYSREFWGGLATDAGKPVELGDAFFLLYSGATAEAQNSNDLWPVKSALKISLDLVNS